MSGDLAGKVAIVTGGASGIGLGTVELFLKEGAKVVIADINDAGREIAAKFGASARFKKTDVSEADEVQALIDFTVAEFGGLHVIYNNAGIPDNSYGSFLEDDFTHFDRVMRVNLLGVMLGAQRAGRHMAKHGGGSIINTSSSAGVLPGYAVYAYRASKAAVENVTKSMAIELGQYNVRVNSIAPAYIRTPMTNFAGPGISPEKAERVRVEVIKAVNVYMPLKLQGLPSDVAQAALFLASDRSRYMTGMVIPVDGGVTAGDQVNHAQNIVAARARVLAG